MKKSDVIHAITQKFTHIHQHIDSLVEVLRCATVNDGSAAYPLPDPTKDDIGLDHQHIQCQTLTAENAFERYIVHLSKCRLNQHRVGQMSVRMPGCIVLQTQDEKEIRERITVINDLKKAFDKFIHQYAGNHVDQRFDTVSKAVPDLVRKAFSRQVLVSPGNTVSVSYAWSHGDSRSKVLHRTHWDKYLDEASRSRSDEQWKQSIAMEKRALLNANDTEYFRTIRPIRVKPIINIAYMEDKRRKKTTCVGHSPLLVLNDSPNITSLRDFKGSTRKDAQADPVIPRLHLFKAASP